MKVKILLMMFAVLSAFLLSSCSSLPAVLGGKETPELFPIRQNGKVGYINLKGEVVIQPHFQIAFFFSEGLAVACLERGERCGYIDPKGKFIINPQFRFAERFSEGLAAVEVEDKVGYIDKEGKFVINPQFPRSGDSLLRPFSEGLASVKIGDKIGFVDREGRIVINPQFDEATPFFDGLAAAKIGNKWGFIDKEGKIVINPQFDEAKWFIEGLAPVRIGEQYGYIDKTGKIVINPQFNLALPFSKEGLAFVTLNQKLGFIDKSGKYVINPQFSTPPNLIREAHLVTYDFGRFSFSEGLSPVKVGDKDKENVGYIDTTGKIVINPQFDLALPFYGGLAFVMIQDSMAYIDKEGKYVWRESKPTTNNNANRAVANAMNSAVNAANTAANTMANTANNSASTSQRTGRLTTDSNLRSESNKDSASLGIHYKGAKIRILDETSFTNDTGELSTWYKIRVTEYGCSVNANLGCGKDPNSSDEGWVNAKNVLID